jgi:hypothetical protein
MKQRIVIEYDIIDKSVKVAENDCTTFEAFGILEAAKMMIAGNWLSKSEGDET